MQRIFSLSLRSRVWGGSDEINGDSPCSVHRIPQRIKSTRGCGNDNSKISTLRPLCAIVPPRSSCHAQRNPLRQQSSPMRIPLPRKQIRCSMPSFVPSPLLLSLGESRGTDDDVSYSRNCQISLSLSLIVHVVGNRCVRVATAVMRCMVARASYSAGTQSFFARQNRASHWMAPIPHEVHEQQRTTMGCAFSNIPHDPCAPDARRFCPPFLVLSRPGLCSTQVGRPLVSSPPKVYFRLHVEHRHRCRRTLRSPSSAGDRSVFLWLLFEAGHITLSNLGWSWIRVACSRHVRPSLRTDLRRLLATESFLCHLIPAFSPFHSLAADPPAGWSHNTHFSLAGLIIARRNIATIHPKDRRTALGVDFYPHM
jgi:hypothetical protein